MTSDLHDLVRRMDMVAFNVYPPTEKIKRIKALRIAAMDDMAERLWLGLKDAKDVVEMWGENPKAAATLLRECWYDHGARQLEHHRMAYRKNRLREPLMLEALRLYHGPVALKAPEF